MSPYGWSYTGTAARLLLQFGLGIVLARLLGPEPFGLIAACFIITTLVQETWDLGTSNALIRPEPPAPGEILGVHLLQIVLGTVLAGLLWVLAGPLTTLVGIPAAAAILPWMALTVALLALGQISGTVLRRDLAFRELQTIQFSALVIGQGLVALGLAMTGHGVWALVIGLNVQVGLTSLGMLIIRPPPWARPRLPRQVLSRGAGFAGTAFINWLMVNLDGLVVARTLGQTQLGEYNRFQYLTINAVGTAVTPLQAVLFPHTARRLEEPHVLMARTIDVGRSLVLVGAPALGCLAAMPVLAIDALFGSTWSTHGAALAWLAAAAGVRALASLPPPILSGMGHPWSVFWTQAAAAGYACAAFLIGWWCEADLTTLAAIVCSVWLVRGLLGYAILLRALQAPAGPLLHGLLPALLLGPAAGLSALAIVLVLPGLPSLTLLIVALVVAYLIWSIALLAMPRLLAPGWLQRIIARLRAPSPD